MIVRAAILFGFIALSSTQAASADDRMTCFSPKAEHKDAISACDRAIARNKNILPERKYLFYWRAWHLSMNGQPDLALDSNDRPIRFDPNYENALAARLELLVRAERFDEAIVLSTEFIAKFPKNWRGHHSKSTAYSGKKDPKNALASLNTAISLAPQIVEMHVERADYLRQLGDIEKSIAELNSIIKRNPKLSDAYLSLGFARRVQGDLDGAIANFDRAIELKPDALSYVRRGQVYEAKLQPRRAEIDYKIALRSPVGFLDSISAMQIARARLAALTESGALTGAAEQPAASVRMIISESPW